MTPADSDLRGMDWMPLFGGKLFTSWFATHASEPVLWTALRLWWVAWLQVPSASLPDDDMELCQLAGLGRDLKKWARMRAADVLHGFVKCTDGRLYHPTLAPQARVAWERRVKERERKRDYRGQPPPTNGNGNDVPRDRTWDSRGTGHGTSGGCPVLTGTETGTESKKGRSPPLPPHGGGMRHPGGQKAAAREAALDQMREAVNRAAEARLTSGEKRKTMA